MKSVRRRDKRGLFVLLGMFVMIFLFTFLSRSFDKLNEEVEAASLANFDPGYIISDYQMGNYNSMSEAEIQAFLSAKGNCRDTRTYLASYYPNLSYHIKDGHFVCLAEETFGDGVVYGDAAPNGESAAHVIWQAAQDYRINPQVLIVLLQKEQGLITDSWPNDRQFKTATGYGCPDTAPCNVEYYGFKNQVRKAAALFRTVLDGGWTNYPLGQNYVQYNPDASCGGSVVNIRSLATSALYRYTPYQPNAGALAAGYGTAACGAYGNRNFYLYFEDWFGGVVDEGINIGDSIKNILNNKKYTIISSLNGGRVVDISGGVDGAKLGTNIQLYDSNNTAAQIWKFNYNIEKDLYSITNPSTGKFLGVNGDNVELVDNGDGCEFMWRITKSQEKYFISSSCKDGKVLDVKGANDSNGANIQVYKLNGTDAQRWSFRELEMEDEQDGVAADASSINDNSLSGIYVISSALKTRKAIDITGGAAGASDGTNIQTYAPNDTDAQKWEFIKNEDETYTIKNPYTEKVLDAKSAGTSEGTNIQLWTSNGSCAQKWNITFEGEYYVFSSACSELVLDVNNASTDDGANIQLWTSNGSDAQKWKVKKVS